MKKQVDEDCGCSVPVNNVGGGEVAGMDLGYPVKKKVSRKLKNIVRQKMIKREPPK